MRLRGARGLGAGSCRGTITDESAGFVTGTRPIASCSGSESRRTATPPPGTAGPRYLVYIPGIDFGNSFGVRYFVMTRGGTRVIYIGNETALKGIIVGMLSTNLNVNRCYRLRPLGKSCNSRGKQSWVASGHLHAQPHVTATVGSDSLPCT